MIIEDILARKIFDSRGNPTIEVDVYLDDGSWGRAPAPAGASTGTYEAVVIPVDDAIAKVDSEVRDQLVGENAADQEEFDALLREIDGTDNFSNIGGNAAVALSMANARAAAGSLGLPLYRYLSGPYQWMPFPLGNVIGGGAHAPGATDIQEFLVTPVGAPTIDEAVLANALVHKRVKKLLTDAKVVCGKGDEGAWAPQIKDAKAFEIASRAVREVSDDQGFEIRLGIDVAATELWKDGKYVYKDAKRTPAQQIDYIASLVDEYNLYYVEDPLQENDFEGFAELTDKVGDRCIICGDDLFVTNVGRLEQGIEQVAANCILIKPNQIGTVTDTFRAIKLARNFGYSCVMSHRSGETCDDTIAHLAVAFGCDLLKTGVVGGERVAKLNELIRIGEEIGSDRMTESPL